jgi:hypothetical protein
VFLFRGKARRAAHGGMAGGRGAGVPARQHLPRRALSYRKGNLGRPASRYSPAKNVLQAMEGGAFILSSLRIARAAPRQSWRGQHWVARRLRGHRNAVRAAGRRRAGAGLLRAMAKALGRLCRVVGRLAGSESARPDDMELHAGRKRQCRADGGNRSGRVPWRFHPSARFRQGQR